VFLRHAQGLCLRGAGARSIRFRHGISCFREAAAEFAGLFDIALTGM
jgi:hypothetical protein